MRTPTLTLTLTFIVALLLSAVVPAVAGPERALSYLDGPQLQEVEKKGIVFSRPDEPEDLQLVPPEYRDSFAADLEEVNPNVISEAVLWIDTEKGTSTRESLLFLMNKFLQVDRLTEIRYYNPDKDKNHVAFDASYRVSEEGSRKRLENIRLTSLPEELEIVVFQKLPPLGPMTSKYVYTADDEHMEMVARNLTPLKYSFLAVIREGNFYTRVVVLPRDEGLILYGVGAIRLLNPFNILGDKIEPFYYRIKGIFQWYREEALLPLE
mgnify:FL=1